MKRLFKVYVGPAHLRNPNHAFAFAKDERDAAQIVFDAQALSGDTFRVVEMTQPEGHGLVYEPNSDGVEIVLSSIGLPLSTVV